MQNINWIVVISTSLIPLLTGFIYYSNQLMGKAWMKEAGLNEDQLKDGAKMGKIMLFALLLGILLSTFLLPVVVHSMHLFSLVMPRGGAPDPNSPEMQDAQAFFAKYGGNYRTFGHGALHGALAAIFGIWPVVGINALFERKTWRYTAIHVVYWIITLALMGGVICAWS